MLKLVVTAFLIGPILLITNHVGLATKAINILFFLLLVAIILEIYKDEKKT